MPQPESKHSFSMEALAREYLEQAITRLQGETKCSLTINVPQLSQLLGINTTAAYTLTRREGFPRLIIGRRILIPIISLLSWLEQQATLPLDEQAAAGLDKGRARR